MDVSHPIRSGLSLLLVSPLSMFPYPSFSFLGWSLGGVGSIETSGGGYIYVDGLRNARSSSDYPPAFLRYWLSHCFSNTVTNAARSEVKRLDRERVEQWGFHPV